MYAETIVCRAATPGDVDRIRAMQERALRSIGRAFYPAETIEAFLDLVTTLDERVIEEGHFYVAETARRRIVATGGWSQLVPRFADMAPGQGEQPFVAAFAVIRSIFVEPRLARTGLGSKMLTTLEWDAMNHGVRHMSLTAPLSGVPFFKARGYHETRRIDLELGEHAFACVKMEQRLVTRAARAA
jgi:GNAT superfamily N-acetyltransferase